MEYVTIDEVDPSEAETDVEYRGLTDPLGATDVAINHFRIGPGEGLPGGLHAHADQEELFVVLEGEATFETLTPRRDEGREVTVGDGEAIRFAPGEYQSGRNEADGDLVVLALGAPRDSENVLIPLPCPECGHDDLRLVWGEDGTILVCPDCDAENVPRGCPECGHEMEVTVDDSATDESGERVETVVVCPDCGAESGTPFGE